MAMTRSYIRLGPGPLWFVALFLQDGHDPQLHTTGSWASVVCYTIFVGWPLWQTATYNWILYGLLHCIHCFCRMAMTHSYIRLGPGPLWCSWWAPRRRRVFAEGRGQRCGGFKRALCQSQWTTSTFHLIGSGPGCLEPEFQNCVDRLHGGRLGDLPCGEETVCGNPKWYSTRWI